MKIDRSFRIVALVVVCLAVGAIPAVRLAGADPGAAGAEEAPRVHRDAAGIEAAALDAAKAFLDDDMKAARAALDRIEQGCQRLDLAGPDRFDSRILTYDRGLHATLDRTREHAGAGEADQAFDQFVWVQRTCRDCHRLAREEGVARAAE